MAAQKTLQKPQGKKRKKTAKKSSKTWLESSAESATKWLGSTASLAVHTVLFIVAAALPVFGIPFDIVLLVVTTLVSLEAIYMNIFIQMAVNKNTADIEEIQEDVDEIQEDIEEIGEDVGEIQEDVEEIQKDVDEIQEDIEEDEEEERAEATQQQKEFEALASIQTILTNLQKEIEQMKKK